MEGEKLLISTLQDTLAKMELAFGSIRESIVWTDTSYNIQWCNGPFDRLIAKPHILILGKQLDHLLQLRKIDGTETETVAPPFAGLSKEENIVGAVYEYVRSGQTLYVEITRSLVSASNIDEINIFTIRDVTELTLSQRALKEAKDNLEARVVERTAQLRTITDMHKNILNQAVDGIITIDVHGIIASFNPAAERIFGYKDTDVIGQNITILMPHPHRTEHDSYISNYLETGRKKIIGIGREVTGVHRNGELIPLDLAVSEVRDNDQIIFTGILRDISEQ